MRNLGKVRRLKNEIKVIAHFASWHLLLWNNIKISVISDMIDENQLKIFSMYANTDLQVCNWNPCFLCALRVLGFTVRVLGFCWAQCLLNDRFKFSPRIQNNIRVFSCPCFSVSCLWRLFVQIPVYWYVLLFFCLFLFVRHVVICLSFKVYL